MPCHKLCEHLGTQAECPDFVSTIINCFVNSSDLQTRLESCRDFAAAPPPVGSVLWVQLWHTALRNLQVLEEEDAKDAKVRTYAILLHGALSFPFHLLTHVLGCTCCVYT
jgi:hypothetical protein